MVASLIRALIASLIRYQGAGSSRINPHTLEAPLDAIRKRAAAAASPSSASSASSASTASWTGLLPADFGGLTTGVHGAEDGSMDVGYEVSYAPGCDWSSLPSIQVLTTAPPSSPQVSYAPGYDWSRCVDDPRALATALELASAAEIVILLIGLPGSYETEGCDREHMRLPSQMNNLCRALAQQVLAPRRLVVVIFGGAAVELPWAGEDL